VPNSDPNPNPAETLILPLVQITEVAAESGHAGILKLALAHGVTLFGEALIAAITGRSIECLKVAVESNPEEVPVCAVAFAGAHGFFEGVRYLHSRGFPLWGEGAPIDAEGLLWLREALKFHMYIECPPDWDDVSQDPWLFRPTWMNQRWYPADELPPAGDFEVPMPQIEWAQRDTPYTDLDKQARAGNVAMPMPHLERAHWGVPYGFVGESALVDVVRVLGNSGVGGDAMMGAGLVPEGKYEPPLLCSWRTVSAAARAAATRRWDWRTWWGTVRARTCAYHWVGRHMHRK
jgi:hypothetical protein